MLTDLTVFVSNPTAALAFYQLLGGSLDGDGSNTLWFGDTAIQVWRGDRPSHVHLSINADDPTSTAAALVHRGHLVEWTDPTRRVFTVNDPDGNTVMVRDAACWRR